MSRGGRGGRARAVGPIDSTTNLSEVKAKFEEEPIYPIYYGIPHQNVIDTQTALIYEEFMDLLKNTTLFYQYASPKKVDMDRYSDRYQFKPKRRPISDLGLGEDDLSFFPEELHYLITGAKRISKKRSNLDLIRQKEAFKAKLEKMMEEEEALLKTENEIGQVDAENGDKQEADVDDMENEEVVDDDDDEEEMNDYIENHYDDDNDALGEASDGGDDY